MHPGQHAAIIDPELWDKVQTQLQATAARKGKSGNGADSHGVNCATQEPAAPLIGRVFDETGDRLTPSHTNRHNRRFRYYVSRRLILGERNPSGWRLPAEGLEQVILRALRQYLMERAMRHDLLLVPDASLALHSAKALQALSQGQDARLWPLVEKVTVAPGHIRIALDPKVIASAAACQIDDLKPASMQIDLPFQLHRRGVETRIVTGTPTPQPDPVLQKNLARAHGWLQQIKRGTTIANIARKDGYSESYIRNRVVLAFLAPKIQRAILAGTIGPEWTTDRLLRIDLPLDWSAQARLLGF